MASVLHWMVEHRDKDYFKNLEYFQISGHNVAAYGNDTDIVALNSQILGDLRIMCNDTYFENLKEMVFDNNGFTDTSDKFNEALEKACENMDSQVTISAKKNTVIYPTMCDDRSRNNLPYYDMRDANDTAQCRFTWNWEKGNINNVYSPVGPFPNSYNQPCPGVTAI